MSDLIEFKGEIYMEPQSKTGYRQKISLERAVLNTATNEFNFTCSGIAQEGFVWRSSARTTLSNAAGLAYAGTGKTEYPRQPDLKSNAKVEFRVAKNAPTDVELDLARRGGDFQAGNVPPAEVICLPPQRDPPSVNWRRAALSMR